MSCIPYYQSPEEACSASQDETDKALGWVIHNLGVYLLMKQKNREDIGDAMDDDELVKELEWARRLLKDEESSLQKIGSMLQSRLRVP